MWNFSSSGHGRWRLLAAALAAACLLGASPAPLLAAGEPEPLECWWRTSVSAVTVGEPFTLVVTCAVLKTESMTAVIDRARLDPRAVELAPFEVLGGVVAPDVEAGDRLFFQNQYTLRFVNDAFFNQDVALPALSVPYRIQTRGTGQEAATQGMERRFAMPHETVRIMSLVPADATDIRDAAAITFADVDRPLVAGTPLHDRRDDPERRSGLSSCSWASGAPSDRASRRRPPRPASSATARSCAASAGSSRPSAAIGTATAGRRTSSPAPSRPPASWPSLRWLGPRASVSPICARDVPAGALLLRGRWRGADAVLVSGSATPKTLALEMATRAADKETVPARLEELRETITALTEAEYAESGQLPGASSLDESLTTLERLARRLTLERSWPMNRLTSWRSALRGMPR